MPPVLRSHTKRAAGATPTATSQIDNTKKKPQLPATKKKPQIKAPLDQAQSKPLQVASTPDDIEDTEDKPYPYVYKPLEKPSWEQARRDAIATGAHACYIDDIAQTKLTFATALYKFCKVVDDNRFSLYDASFARDLNLQRRDGLKFSYEIMPFIDSSLLPSAEPYTLPLIRNAQVLHELSMRELSWYLQGYGLPVPCSRSERIDVLKKYIGINV
ncbi:hypothetical protein BD626DRAFT_574821 [Schizophyllum amplum]|uniref:Mug135-like C-terminal domain-containing protein n=1 Tax=Schizophyllum amplum TaxID=97359 RepID=A0A550BX60_9AGAR|nr:hypothetical protein BD626DRAFT_574821 [Auriculariopsis ampla]